MKHLKQLCIIYTITCIAEVFKYLIPFPIPSSIYGMVILFVLLCLKIVKPEDIEEVSMFLISCMGIMFVPAGVGIVKSYDYLLAMLPAVLLSICIITALVMIVAGKITDILIKKEIE